MTTTPAHGRVVEEPLKLSLPTAEKGEEDAMMQRVVVAPMVRGSELAFRMFLRSIYHPSPLLCYTPMLRAPHVIAAQQQQQETDVVATAGTTTTTTTVLHEDGRLFLQDLGTDAHFVVVQLCGSSPTELFAATTAILERYPHIHGIDLNLGCPQSCAREGRFGAFLAPTSAMVACLQAMRRAIVQQQRAPQCVLSCKIRLQDTEAETIEMARALQEAGVDRIAVHCRKRDAKFDGAADLVMGRKIVEALDIPVWINGAHIKSHSDISCILQATGAPRLMLARDLLANPRLLLSGQRLLPTTTDGENDSAVAAAAADYLAYAARYPPPSAEYLQVHLKWIFRSVLQPPKDAAIDYSNWRHRLWNFLRRPYLVALLQFQYTVALFVHQAECQRPASLPDDTVPLQPTYSMIRHLHKNTTTRTLLQQKDTAPQQQEFKKRKVLLS